MRYCKPGATQDCIYLTPEGDRCSMKDVSYEMMCDEVV